MISRATRRGAAVLAAAAALTSVASAHAAPLFSASESMTDTTANAHLGLSMQMYGSKIPDLATAQRIARQYTVITANAGQLNTFGAAMKQANPNLQIFLYQNGMFAQSNQGSMFPSAWYMRAKNGAKIQSKGYGNYLMNPESTATYTARSVTYTSWGDYVAKTARAQLTAAGAGAADGVFLDMLGTAPLSAGYNQNNLVPVDAGGRPFSADTWYSDISSPIADQTERVSGEPVIANGIGSGTRYFDSSRRLLDFATAGDAEVWMRVPGSGVTAWPSETRWRNETQALADSAQSDRGMNATVKMWSGGTAAQVEQWRRFALGSFLIGNQGHATFEFSPQQKMTAWADDSPLYHMAIGTPTQTLADVTGYLQNGVYQRSFTNGRVLVNTGAAAITVTLGGTYHTVSGIAVTQVTVPAHDASILTLS
jgi:hypothetical protein